MKSDYNFYFFKTLNPLSTRLHTHSSSISKQVFADETHDLEKQQTADAIYLVSFQLVKCEIDIDCEAKALFIYCIACVLKLSSVMSLTQ